MTHTVAPKSLAYWFLLLCFWIVGTAVIGAITRLTDSGLSMMNWDAMEFWWPSPARITEYYLLYQETPESQVTQFTRREFVPRFFWEWFHRNWGRALGLIALFGLMYFAVRRQIPKAVLPATLAAPFLIAFQGVLGWFMVSSGFANDMGVSHFRLALHLGGAFVAFGIFYWTALNLLLPQAGWRIPVRPWAWASVALFPTLVFGAFTAGLNAADVSSSWPHFLPGRFLPPGLCDGAAPWRSACWVNSPRGVHFVHRNLALIAAGLILLASFWTWVRAAGVAARWIAVLGGLTVLVQTFLGIWIVVAGGLIANPTAAKQTVAVLHQIGAFALLTVTLTAIYGRPRLHSL